ncbi:MAG: glutamate-1-semialdehyde 2,1-aminomutase, partial [Anaerovoracaceae bacterium]
MRERKNSELLFDRAKKVMPGGVNSPVRAYQSVGLTPKFIDRAKGNKIYDIEGNEYLDYVGSWGPMILGHADPEVIAAVRDKAEKGLSFGACTEAEVELAELITENISHIEMIRMVNSGTEAVMSALRLARGYTRRDKIIKFEGCYHGHSDAMLVKAGSGAMTFGDPDSAGVTRGAAEDTLLARYNDLNSVESLMKENRDNVACVIVEPAAANMGVVPAAEGFLKGLRQLCDKYGALLIFDEVITGFRLSFGGAAEYFDVRPDLVTYGKIIGGGMPVGAYGGSREIM